jgi:superfamily II DNA/RNA helicase
VLPEIVDALHAVDIAEAFPIQEMALPIALMGTDLIGQARTGTGKTLAFAIPVLQRVIAPHDPDYAELAAPHKPQALVVTPTRELTLQVASDFEIAGSKRGCRTLTVYGGVAYEPQLDALRTGVEIVVGTPGRLLDLAARRALDLSHVKVLVLDEADEMLDLGFLPDVEKLISKTPELRQTMLFSATMRGEVVTLARTHMRHPVNVRAESAGEAELVPATAQFVYQTHDLDKPEILARILQAENRGLSIVFTRTKRQAQRVAEDLIDRGFPAAPLHGDMAQIARERAMKRFREGKVEILVATDVAARGIDVEGITHVVNYSCPEDEKTYVHRTGRTGRAGATGIAITFVDWSDLTRWKVINNALDLPYDNPAETYSTSEWLYHDHGIPHDAQGRIGPAKPPRAEREAKPERRRDDDAGDRPQRTRSRSRTRGAQSSQGTREQKPAGSDAPAAEVASGDETRRSSGARSRNRRRRSRTRGGAPASPPAS